MPTTRHLVKIQRNLLFIFITLSAVLFFAGVTQAQSPVWQPVTAPQSQSGVHIIVGNEEKTVNPECALGDPYQFYFKQGTTQNLLVYFNSGGACWDSNTCVGSLNSSLPTYSTYSVNAPPSYPPFLQNNPNKMGGILGQYNKSNSTVSNPYANWSMLFISYCTGDIHIGSADTTYTYSDPVSGFKKKMTIHHHGFDNFLYAMSWLTTTYPTLNPSSILVAGSSAGSYGASLNFPWVKKFYPTVKNMSLLGDGGAGVFQNAPKFVDSVFGYPSNWGIQNTLDPMFSILPALVSAWPESFVPATYTQLGIAYPKGKFAQYTTAYDVIQTLFWDIMLNWKDPAVWGNPTELATLMPEWRGYMNANIGELDAFLPKNYRSYIGPGCNHTVLPFDDDFYNSSLTSSGNKITFLQWFAALTGANQALTKNWQNLSCKPGVSCGEETVFNPNGSGIEACLTRTINAPW